MQHISFLIILIMAMGKVSWATNLPPLSGFPPLQTIQPSNWNGEDFCSLPLEVGKCNSPQPRFFFNTTSRQCEEFTYSGCDGNPNNYLSIDECIIFCRPVTNPSRDPANICTQPKIIGPCRAAFPRFYFNTQSGQCERFLFGGCDGNQNNFDSETQCERLCETLPTPARTMPLTPPLLKTFPENLEQMNELNKRNSQQNPLPVNLPMTSLHTSHLLSTSYSLADPSLNSKRGVLSPFYRAKITNPSYIRPRSVAPVVRQNKEEEELDNPGFYQRSSSGQRRNPSSYSIFQMGRDFVAQPNTNPTFNCRDKRDVGQCDQSQIRFWFNPDTQFCEQFSFGGCGGNGNNFELAQNCLINCNAKGLSVEGIVFRRSN